MKTFFMAASLLAFVCVPAWAQTGNPPALSEARAAEIKEKDALIAKLLPTVMQPGDLAHGKQMFAQNCQICHRFAGIGKDLGPDLTDAGALGRAELLLHVLDPNRVVEPDYYTTTISTQDGEDRDGVVVREDKNGLMVRTMSGQTYIKIADISGRKLTGRSLMPVGFESLGAEGIRDIISYIEASRQDYRIIDLQHVFDADSRQGLWGDDNDAGESLNFKKCGLVREGDVPFLIVHPLRIIVGKNVLVLKGGPVKAQPQRVDVSNVGVKAVKLDFLGGIGAGAYPAGGEGQKDIPVAKVTVHYEDGQSEEIILKNGEEFGDWKTAGALPAAADASDLLKQGVLRCFTKSLAHPGVIQSLSLESYGNDVAPAFVAITAETGLAPEPAK